MCLEVSSNMKPSIFPLHCNYSVTVKSTSHCEKYFLQKPSRAGIIVCVICANTLKIFRKEALITALVINYKRHHGE